MSLEQSLALAGLIVAVIAVIAAVITPEIRRMTRLDLPTPTPAPTLTPAPTFTSAPPTITPEPSATPLPITSAKAGESLIVVANFTSTDDMGDAVAVRIYEDLREVAPDEVRIERYKQPLDHDTARPFGETISATLVIWGRIDALGVRPFIERIHEQTEFRPRTTELSLAVPPSVTFQILTSQLPREVRYLSLFSLAMDAYETSTLTETLGYLDRAIEAAQSGQSNTGDVYFFRAFVHDARSDLDRAFADIQRAIELKPDFAEAYVNRGKIYTDKRDYDRALADYNKAIQLAPNLAIVYNNRGTVYTDKRDYDRAIADFDKAIQLNPNRKMQRFITTADLFTTSRATTAVLLATTTRPSNLTRIVTIPTFYAGLFTLAKATTTGQSRT